MAKNNPSAYSLDAIYQRGLAVLHRERWDEAIKLFLQIKAIDPAFKNTATCLAYARGRQALAQENWDEAIANLEPIAPFEDAHTWLYVAQSKKEAQRLYQNALQAAAAYNWEEAVNALRQAVNLDPAHQEAAQKLAEVNQHLQASQLFNYGYDRLANKDWQKAADVFEKIIKTWPQYPQIEAVKEALAQIHTEQRLDKLRREGLAHFDAGRWQKAIAVFTRYRQEVSDDELVNARLAEAQRNDDLRPELLRPLSSSQKFGRWMRTKGIIFFIFLALLLLCYGGLYTATSGQPLEAFSALSQNVIAYLQPSPTPTPAVTSTPTAAPTATETPSPTATASPIPSPTASQTPTAAPTETPTPTLTPQPTATNTNTTSPSPTPGASTQSTATNTASAIASPTGTATQTAGPTLTATATPSATPTATAAVTVAPTATPISLYTVQFGDTLSEIAEQFNSSILAFQALNNIADPNTVRVGQVLVIPSGNEDLSSFVPPATPTPGPQTPAAPPTASPPGRFPAPTLISPVADDTVSNITKFVWEWNGPALNPNHSFELRIWEDGRAHDGAYDARLMTPAQVCPSPPICSLIIPVNQTRNFVDNGAYFWTVAVVQLQPYNRIGDEAPAQRIFFNR